MLVACHWACACTKRMLALRELLRFLVPSYKAFGQSHDYICPTLRIAQLGTSYVGVSKNQGQKQTPNHGALMHEKDPPMCGNRHMSESLGEFSTN